MTRRICIGRRDDGEIGLWVTRPGIDAFDPDPDEDGSFIIDSRWGDLERLVEAASITGDYNWGGGSTRVGQQILIGHEDSRCFPVLIENPASGQIKYDWWNKNSSGAGGSPAYYTPVGIRTGLTAGGLPYVQQFERFGLFLGGSDGRFFSNWHYFLLDIPDTDSWP